MTDDQIHQALLGIGWQEKDVNEALLQTQPKTAKSILPKSTLTIILIIGLVLAIVGYFASAYYFNLYPFGQTAAPISTFTARPTLLTAQSTPISWLENTFGALPQSRKRHLQAV